MNWPLLILVAAAPPDALLTSSARLPAEKLEVGKKYEFIVTVRPASGWSAGKQQPAPLLQIDVPDCARLTGKVLTEAQQRRNEFIALPFEQLLKAEETRVAFEVTAAPGPDDRFGLNIVGYLNSADDSDMRFVRQRLELPLAPGARAQPGDETKSSWGNDPTLLKIGDKLPALQLPQADGAMVSLADAIGKKHIVLTTYRAFW